MVWLFQKKVWLFHFRVAFYENGVAISFSVSRAPVGAKKGSPREEVDCLILITFITRQDVTKTHTLEECLKYHQQFVCYAARIRQTKPCFPSQVLPVQPVFISREIV